MPQRFKPLFQSILLRLGRRESMSDTLLALTMQELVHSQNAFLQALTLSLPQEGKGDTPPQSHLCSSLFQLLGQIQPSSNAAHLPSRMIDRSQAVFPAIPPLELICWCCQHPTPPLPLFSLTLFFPPDFCVFYKCSLE